MKVMTMATTIPDADDVLGSMTAAVHEHHSDLWAELTLKENELLRVVAVAGDFTAARDDFVALLRGEVAEHLEAEQTVLYGAVRGQGSHALVQALDLDHQALIALIDHLEGAESGFQAAMAARSLVLLFALRMEKEESVVLPMLREAGVDVDALLAGQSQITGRHGTQR